MSGFRNPRFGVCGLVRGPSASYQERNIPETLPSFQEISREHSDSRGLGWSPKFCLKVSKWVCYPASLKDFWCCLASLLQAKLLARQRKSNPCFLLHNLPGLCTPVTPKTFQPHVLYEFHSLRISQKGQWPPVCSSTENHESTVPAYTLLQDSLSQKNLLYVRKSGSCKIQTDTKKLKTQQLLVATDPTNSCLFPWKHSVL